MRKNRKLCSMLLALSLICGQVPMVEAQAAEGGELTFAYETIGNTGARIQITSGQEVTANVEDSTIATAQVDGDTITVTGAEGAEGIAKVDIAYGGEQEYVVEVPIGYTTFAFEGDSVCVYEGSDTKYEINTMMYADPQNAGTEMTTGVEQTDGSVRYTNTEDVKININIKKKGGTYVFTGKGNDMSISVNKEAAAEAELLLAGLDLTATYTAPVVIKKDSTADASVVITALEGHTNILTDTETNNADLYGDPTEDGGDGTNTEYAESACIKAKTAAKVTLNGKGTLELNCASKNAVKVGESGYLKIEDINLDIVTAGHGISSDNTLAIDSGNFTIDAAADAVRSDPDAVDATAGCAGVIDITGGTFSIKAGSDGIQAAQDLNISGGNFEIQTGAGYNDSTFNKDTMSCKGLKASCNADETTTTDTSEATNTIEITGGKFTFNTADDAVHSDAYIVISGGDFTIKTGDDGVHADTSLTLGQENGLDEDVSITVENSYEGLEGGCIYLYSGTYHVAASDDGINAAGDGTASDTTNTGDNFNPGGGPGRPGQAGGGPGNVTSGCNINIAGGNVYVNVDGDGLDANDSLNLSGGKIVVFGAAAGSDNQPLDCDGTITINGATVFAAGSASMGVSISSDSQNTVTYGSSGTGGMGGMMPGGSSGSSTISSGKTINVVNNDTTVYNIKALKNVNYVLYSSPAVTSSGWSIVADDSELLEDLCQGEHTYDAGVVTTAATCTKTGVRTCTCTVCGEKKTEVIPMTDHVFENYVSNHDATTEKDGTKTAKCKYCDATDTITDAGSKLQAGSSGDGNGSTADASADTKTDTDTAENGSSQQTDQTQTEVSTGESSQNITEGKYYTDKKTNIRYKVLSTKEGKKTVSCVGVASGKKITRAVIPPTVTIQNEKYAVTKIAAGAFKKSTALKTVIIGKNVEEIGKKAFYQCSNLKKIVIKSQKLKKTGSKMIAGIYTKAEIQVPGKKSTAYKKLFSKKTGYKNTMKVKKA